jgi:hypothetical protein
MASRKGTHPPRKSRDAIPCVGRATDHLELGWLLNEIGMLTTKLTELLSDLNDHMEFIENSKANGAEKLR